MEKKMVDNLVAAIIKSNDKNVIYKALVKLRVDLVKDKSGIVQFYDAGGVAPLVRLLSKPYEKILEVALSILGNCCTQKVCSKQALKNRVLPTLLTILKSIPNARVQCRVCRLLGNLARESNEKLCTLAKGIGVTLASTLEDSKDTPTLSMAVRAVRLLWNEMPFCEEFVRYEGVSKILIILVNSSMIKPNVEVGKSITEQNPYERERVQFMEKYIPIMETMNSGVFDNEISKTIKPPVDAFVIPDEQEKKELFSEILRCLETVTNVSAFRIIYSFYHNKHSCGCVSFCANASSPFRSQALKILSNLSKSNGNNILNEPDVITTACNLITSSELAKPLSESEERHCVNIICFLAFDACNRAKIRKSGAFKRLLEIARDTQSDSLLTTILIGLQHFRFDNMSIDLLIAMGLVNVLIKQLELNIKDLNEPHNTTAKSENKRQIEKDDDDDDDSENSKRTKIDFNSPSFMPRKLYSPPPNTSPSSSTSSRGMSPSNTANSYDDIEDYSPVVSDIEDQEEEEENNPAMFQIVNEQSSSKCDLEEESLVPEDDMDEETTDKEINAFDISEKKKTIQLILGILCSATYRLKQSQFELSLCTPEILNTLIKTCRVVYKKSMDDASWDSQGAPLVLSHIVSETKNFVPLLKRDFIFKVYDMTQHTMVHEKCSLCQHLKVIGSSLLEQLSQVAETGYGRGEMAHLLLKGDEEMSQRASIISALLVRDPNILNTLLLKHGGLYNLIEIIVTKDATLSNEAATGLTALAKHLKIETPNCEASSDETVSVYGAALSEESANVPEEDIITFISGKKENPDSVGGDTRVRFSKKTLTENSDVFNRMFNSDFRESKDKEVVMKDQSLCGIRYFLDCINQYSKKRPLRRPVANADPIESTSVASEREELATFAITAALEAYDICQIYLLPDLAKDIFDMIIQIIDADNVLTIFQYSLSHHRQELTELSVTYFLSSNITSSVKVKLFRQAEDSEYYKEWNELILDSIVYNCQNIIC